MPSFSFKRQHVLLPNHCQMIHAFSFVFIRFDYASNFSCQAFSRSIFAFVRLDAFSFIKSTTDSDSVCLGSSPDRAAKGVGYINTGIAGDE
jgi:hypothetical protein